MITISFDEAWENEFLKKVSTDGPWANWEMFQLAYESAQHEQIPSFHGLQSLKHLPTLRPYPHQIEVATTVIEKMNGKAILADEVGLGKTIEAGLILKEYMIRGLAKKVLILVPASLVSQWTAELTSKFQIPAVAQKKAYVWDECDIVVASIDTAKRKPHCDIILNHSYDLVIIDEAHKLKNPKTKNYEFIKRLQKKFCLLLTATPIQNKLDEIFNLVSLLKPGHLGNMSAFEKNFRSKKRTPKNEEQLKELIKKVMVRNRRIDTGVEWTKRIVKNITIHFNNDEREFYDDLMQLKGKCNPFTLLTLKREICSSREAVFLTLQQMITQNKREKENAHIDKQMITSLLNKVNDVQGHAKAEKALELIQEIDDKVIIFTEYRATQLYLQWYLKQNGITSVPFSGGFRSGKKDWMRQLFEQNAQVLIATEAGGEGINLQFCNHIINYDLPWNPMKIEQRIGRVHRFGQTKDVYIYNFAVKDTIEQHILTLLYDKIHLFEAVVGELDEILTKIQLPSIEKHIQEIVTESDSTGEMQIKFDHLSAIINDAATETTGKQGDQDDATATSS